MILDEHSDDGNQDDHNHDADQSDRGTALLPFRANLIRHV